MKRILSILLCLMLCLSLLGCEYEQPETVSSDNNSSNSDTTSIVAENSTANSKREPNAEKEQSSSQETVVMPSDEEIMVSQFKSLGFTDVEAQDMQKVFENVGITKISNISKFIQGNGIDGEQGFYCDFYYFNVKNDSIRLDFKIVKRKLQIIAISWARGKNYPDIDKYNDMILHDGVKESDYGSYVYLYYKKLKNFEVIENYNGYRAIYDNETHSISKYN